MTVSLQIWGSPPFIIVTIMMMMIMMIMMIIDHATIHHCDNVQLFILILVVAISGDWCGVSRS